MSIAAVVSGDKFSVPVVYLRTAWFRCALVADRKGAVRPAPLLPDARSIVGYCDEPDGVLAGRTGLMETV